MEYDRAVRRLVGHLWAAPLSGIGLVLALIYRPVWWRWHQGVLHVGCRRLIPGWAVAQTWGGVVCYRAKLREHARYQAVITHELVHVRQAMLLGPLFLLAYPLASLWAWARGGHYYEDNWFERQARGE